MIAALAAAAAVAGGAGETPVTIAGRAFLPSRVTVLAGETVRWTNQDHLTHTVSAQDESFDSGRVVSGDQFSRRFPAAGTYAYRCTLHREMRGAVEVVELALEGPERPPRAGTLVRLQGRSPAPGEPVALERAAGGEVARTVAGEDGRFGFTVPADAPRSYRARAGRSVSAALTVTVAPEVRLAARRTGGLVSVRVHVTPPQPGAVVLLERHVRERFGYVRMRRLVLDASSRARVRLGTTARLRLRARLARPVGGYARATGGVVVVPRRGHARQDNGHH